MDRQSAAVPATQARDKGAAAAAAAWEQRLCEYAEHELLGRRGGAHNLELLPATLEAAAEEEEKEEASSITTSTQEETAVLYRDEQGKRRGRRRQRAAAAATTTTARGHQQEQEEALFCVAIAVLVHR